jgi:hypothetical protein
MKKELENYNGGRKKVLGRSFLFFILRIRIIEGLSIE